MRKAGKRELKRMKGIEGKKETKSWREKTRKRRKGSQREFTGEKEIDRKREKNKKRKEENILIKQKERIEKR